MNDVNKLLNRMILDGAAINAMDHIAARVVIDGVAMITTADVKEAMKVLRETLEDVIKNGNATMQERMFLDPNLAQQLKDELDKTTVSEFIIKMVK